MQGHKLVPVRATKRDYRGLKHEPDGTGLDENGEGLWPADQFTFRLRDEGAIKLLDAEEFEAARKEREADEAKEAAAAKAQAEAAEKPARSPPTPLAPVQSSPAAKRAGVPSSKE